MCQADGAAVKHHGIIHRVQTKSRSTAPARDHLADDIKMDQWVSDAGRLGRGKGIRQASNFKMRRRTERTGCKHPAQACPSSNRKAEVPRLQKANDARDHARHE